MSLRAVEHIFNGETTPITSYDPTKTSLGTLMIQKSGDNPGESFVGPFPVAIARPMEESTAVAMMFPHVLSYDSTTDLVFMIENTTAAAKRIFLYEYNKILSSYNWKGFITATTPFANSIARGFRALQYLHTTGTVAVSAPLSFYSAGTSVALAITGVVTGIGTTFTIDMVGKMMGFGSTNPAEINCWYPIITFTSTTSITVLGASSIIAASANYVIASCTLTGSGTQFVTERIAAGTSVTAVAGGGGPRIGFGSTDPTQITQWYQIGAIASDTSLNLTTSPGVIPTGTLYVIEEFRFAMAMINGAAANGGLFLLKGVGLLDFRTAGTTFPSISSNLDNQRGVYWLADALVLTNNSSTGLAIEDEIDKTIHYAYVLNGSNTSNARIYKYNLRANDVVTAGRMILSGGNIISTGIFAVTGLIPSTGVNNGIIATLSHGPGIGNAFFYFVTNSRLYCAAVSGITAGSTTFITTSNSRTEIPPGSTSTFAATNTLMNVQYILNIDRLLITTYTVNSSQGQYVTQYPIADGVPFDHVFGVEDKQQDQSALSSNGIVHFNLGVQSLTADSNNGIIHISRNGVASSLAHMYALPFGAHWTYAGTTNQRVITPAFATPDCVKFDKACVSDENYLGKKELRIPTEPYRVYYRTSDIATNATSSWVLVDAMGDLSSLTPANEIQFMFEFFTIGNMCIPARILNVAVIYEDNTTDSHFQMSVTNSDSLDESFAWRFSERFGKIMPILKIELFNAVTGALVLTDDTDTPSNGTWEKSLDGGDSWAVYDTNDKTNDITYIRYTPTNLTNDITVRALLTQS